MPDTVTIRTDWIKVAAAVLAFLIAVGSWTFVAGASYEQLEKAQAKIVTLDAKYEILERKKQDVDIALVNMQGKLALIDLRLTAIEKGLDRLAK